MLKKQVAAWLLMIALCALFAALGYDSCNNRKPIKQAQKAADASRAQVQKVRNQAGDSVYRKEVITGTQQVLDVIARPKYDSVVRALGIRKKQIDELQMLVASAHLQTDVLLIHDTLQVPVAGLPAGWVGDCFNYQDSTFDVTGCLSDSNRVHLETAVNVGFNSTIYWKRKHKLWFVHWGPVTWWQDIQTSDPRIRVDNVVTLKKSRE